MPEYLIPSTEVHEAPEVTLTRASTITPAPIRWLWRGFLAAGKLHILAGAPGTGKTTIALALAAAVTSGGHWPDGTRAKPGNVLIWSGEDDAADTLIPRLQAAAADLDRCYIVGSVNTDEGPRPFDPAHDLAALEYKAAQLGEVALLIADPVVSAVMGDSHKNTEVRRALQPLVNLGARVGCAVLGVSHFTKGSAGKDPTERVVGSIAFGAIARVVLVAAKRAEAGDGPERLFARAKSNIGPDGGGFAYVLEQAETDGIEASRVRWGEPLEGTARELLGDMEATESPRSDAIGWLEDALIRGPAKVADLQREAKAAGMSWRTVQNAKRDLKVTTERISEGNTGGGYWVWKLPGKATSARPQAYSQNVAVLPRASNGAGSSGNETARPQDRSCIGTVADLRNPDGAEIDL